LLSTLSSSYNTDIPADPFVKDMKFAILPVLLAVAVSALSEPQTVCIASCQKIKPPCDPGYAPSGSKGCWGCCRPVAEN